MISTYYGSFLHTRHKTIPNLLLDNVTFSVFLSVLVTLTGW